ncbi:hypothetical protein MJL81_19465, partial [Salmonella enterica subsp. enterica serovar Anatum]|nr:hypothetical protein [Salmonella enterica subsp. enterica serovar Anatum]
MQRLTVYSHPLRIIWQEAPSGRLLQGATPVYAKTLISRLFTLCAQAHSAAAALLLFPEDVWYTSIEYCRNTGTSAVIAPGVLPSMSSIPKAHGAMFSGLR